MKHYPPNVAGNLISVIRCFHGFTSHENLVKHAENCERFKVQGVKFPDDDKLEFRSYKKMVLAPVYIVAGMVNCEVHDEGNCIFDCQTDVLSTSY